MNDEPDRTQHDDPHDDPQASALHELASAYVDGEATAAERAQVNSSPQLQALVASFQQVHLRVADTPLVSSSTRDAAFAAAFAAFGAATATLEFGGEVTDTAAAPVIDLAARRRWPGRVLSAAAGLLLVGVVGVAVMNSRTDDSSSSSNTLAADGQSANGTESGTAAGDAPDSMSAPAPTVGSFNGSAEVATVVDTPEQLLALEPPGAADATAANSPAETIAPTAETSQAAAETTAKSIASDVAARRSALDCLTTDQVFLANIQYQGVFAIAARDTVTGVTTAITDDCTVLASVGP